MWFLTSGPVCPSLRAVPKLSCHRGGSGEARRRCCRDASSAAAAPRLRQPAPTLHQRRRLLHVHPRVRAAVAADRPVVALESTILAHGLPYPQNWALARRLRDLLATRGVQAATVAVRDGVCRVGLEMEELHDLCLAGQEGRATKCSTRDLPRLMATQRQSGESDDYASTTSITTSSSTTNPTLWGATTVASTMLLAHRAGIRVFCTGGIGGVHRGAEQSMDVSADLLELARTPVIVVSAGIKSILDVRKTLEVLETHSVPTLAYGTDEFPAFFSPHSGVPAPARVDAPEQVADVYWAAHGLGLPQGLSVAVPNADPAGAQVEAAIQAALREAAEHDIAGPAVTPFVLRRVADATGGDSLRSNLALVEQNARVSADIAVAVCRRRPPPSSEAAQEFTGAPAAEATSDVVGDLPSSPVVIFGGCVSDLLCRPLPDQELLLHTSNPARCIETDGGVARNVAEVLGRLGRAPLFYSVIGDDARGAGLLRRLQRDVGRHVADTVQVVPDKHTATYVAAFDGSGDLHTAFADMKILEEMTEVPPRQAMEQAKILVVDANPPIHLLREAAQEARQVGLQVFFEPTSVPKAQAAARDAPFMSCLTAAFPNAAELVAMANAAARGEEAASEPRGDERPSSHDWSVDELKVYCTTVLNRMTVDSAFLVVTLGERGVLLAVKDRSDGGPAPPLEFQHFPAPPNVTVANSSGAGDSLCGAFIHALLDDHSLPEAVAVGMEAAVLSLACPDRAVSPRLATRLRHRARAAE